MLISFCAFAQKEGVPGRPNPPRLVNDLTNNTLQPEQVQALEQKLVAYNDSTSTQIAIVIIPTTNGNSIEDMALDIMRDWGVGTKANNNGIVILVARDDHKITIQTGYGLEGAIPDLTAKSIIDNEITPNFKQENYYRGLDGAVDALIRAAAGQYKAPEGYGKKKGKGIGFGAIIFIIILIVLFSSRGGGGGGMASRRGYRDFGAGWLLGTLLSGGGGGGGWSGGGGGGGGFGGFGGGSGGGGGASGSW